ncbi:hypothetical protein [Rhodopseudomonas pseudopalustris]|uniref:Uncharacterized protein n=1 Tax=Rhodopseudomonas pseudopalustris TaxID=1513892 RepID=A0A1H8P9F8_9BRAD|nr:hypothetical protein [Rhodopseudomonas pseudopalustris]SEO38552.1 hypothetical protein SAMN05444123_102460 [Rhodopseudomonas pseudopalustris]
MAEEALFTVTSEEDAWALLRNALEKRGDIPDDLEIVWSGWPTLRIYLPNVPEDATISTSMMSAIISLQTSIYRTHALLSKGNSNLRTLTQIERDQFEIRVKVEKGSSDLSINLNDILAKYGNEIIAKMTGTDLLILVLGLALIYAGKLAFSDFLKFKSEQRKAASDDQKTKGLLDTFETYLQHDSKRTELLSRALEAAPVLKQIQQSANSAKEELVRAVADERGGKIQGIELPKDVANEISSKSRTQSSEARSAGQYRVAKVDTTVANGFRVTLEDIESGEIVTASLFDAIISAEHRTVLQSAEWNKKPLFVEMSGRRLRGKMVDAKIVSVSAVEDA